MIRVFVDSGSSIKQEERERYGVEILPLKILLGGEEYEDGLGLTNERFYQALIEDKQFPKTSLPALDKVQERVEACLAQGDEVLILSLSSGLSGTFGAIQMLFANEPRVQVVDTKTAVGGIRILVEEVNRRRQEPLDTVVEHVRALIPRIRIVAVPETLEYLHRGGRLSKGAYAIGQLLQIKPLIGFDDGRVCVLEKARGMKRAYQQIVAYLEICRCDPQYPIVPSYTYDPGNLRELIAYTPAPYRKQMTDFDNLDHAIACHWGPNAFGYIFVAGE